MKDDSKIMYDITMNKNLTKVILSIILFLGITLLISSIFIANKKQNKITEQQLQSYLDLIESENKKENASTNNTLNIIKDWVCTSSLNKNDIIELNKRFIPLVSNTSQLSAVSICWSTGETYNIRYEEPNYESYFSMNDSSNQSQVWLIHSNNDQRLVSEDMVKYSVKSLPSYRDHLYEDFDTIIRYALQPIPGINKLEGVAFSIKTKDVTGTEYIITIYKSLRQIYTFLNSIKVSESSEIHLFTPKGLYFDYSKLDLLNDISRNNEYLVSWEEAAGTKIYTALADWDRNLPHDTVSYLRFKHKKENYLAAFKPNGKDLNGTWTALIIHEADFGLILKGNLKFLFIIAILLILISGIFILRIFRRIGNDEIMQPLDDIALKELIYKGENDFVEFKSTIRYNLHTNKMGKEIELAWLKSVAAFCNTDGGRILIGVKDDGEILGLEADRFPNEDKTLLHIQNLIKQHIGLEFINYINFNLREINEKNIVVIRCQAAQEPIFLRANDKEQFYVRSGPASIELPVSKALQYIKDRKT